MIDPSKMGTVFFCEKLAGNPTVVSFTHKIRVVIGGYIYIYIIYIYIYIWVNYNELTMSSMEIIVSKGNHPQMVLVQVSELL